MLRFAVASTFVALIAVAVWEQSQYRRLDEQLAQARVRAGALERENQLLRAQRDAVETTPLSRDQVRIQDSSGVATLDRDGTIVITGRHTVPFELSRSVRELLSGGPVTPVDAVQRALDAVRADDTRGTAAVSGSSVPVPVLPVRSAVRSVRPALEWMPVAAAHEYRVTVVDREGNVVWHTSAGSQTQVVPPPGVLLRARIYFWQVEAIVNGESRLSPTAGFWVLDDTMLRAVEDTERKYPDSALVRASVYAAYGLRRDALAQLERLAGLNNDNPQLKAMLDRLRQE
jgi:hypothetical protein